MIDFSMSESLQTAPPPKSSIQNFIERQGIIWIIWITVIVSQWGANSQKLLRGEVIGNDDFMRITQIRDWLGGQSWFDLHQYRLNPQDPLLSHWSRLPDLLIGGPIKLLTPLFGEKTAEMIVVVSYPSILFLILMYVLVSLALKLSKTASIPLAVGFMTALSIPTFVQYRMGRIDHHGLQILMAAACCLFIIKSADNPRNAIIAGILAGLGLYVGIESGPYVAAACIAITLIWVFNEPESEKRMRYFGVSLAATTLASLLLSAPISRWAVPSCDAISVVYTELTIAIALVLIILSAISRKINKPISRLVVAGVLGLTAVAITVGLYPNCLKGPYAEVDPRLVEVWLVNVSEAVQFHTFIRGDIVSGMASITLPIFSLIGIVIYHSRTKNGLAIAPRSLLIFTIVTFAAGLVQTRLMAFACCLAIPLSAYVLATSMDWADKFKSMIKRLSIRMGFIVILAPITIPLLFVPFVESDATQTPTEKNELTCVSQPTINTLNSLPKGLAITQIDLGASILYYTDLSVTSAPYHRNTGGNVTAFDMFIEDEATAKSAVERNNADYVIVCADMAETAMLVKNFPDGMLAKLKAGEAPNWLEKIELDHSGDLLVYRVIAEK
jgi:hypothetical protein